jgi:tight adherence protein B
VARVRTVGIAVIGSVIVAVALRAARRFAVTDRLREPSAGARRVVPAVAERRIATALDAAAFDVSVVHALQLWVGATAALAIFAVSFGGVGAAIAAMVAGCATGPAVLFSLRGRRNRLIAAAVPATIDRVASELRAGGTIATAVSGIARSDGALAADFSRIDARLALGASTGDALRSWARERVAPGVDVAAAAFSMCATVGGRSADALEGLASSLRDRLALVAEARALSAQARMSAVVVGGAPLLYMCWSAIADQHALHVLTATTTGRVCVLLGIGLELAGMFWMRRILRNGSFL